MSRDEDLRKRRLVLYENHIQHLNVQLDTFLELSKARCALLVDRGGHLVTRRGEPVRTSEDKISSLIAGSFAVTMEMSRLLGDGEFSILFHQGARDSIQLQLIAEQALLASLFDHRTNLGMVRYYAHETCKRMVEILQKPPRSTA